ncbi:Methyltransferase domain-containing protein [Marinilactibacillus psychrotolerans]|nr:methyltransferase [Marinilactibacillus psychrotolerans]SDC31044.1 Methyltransferase domain-containing protein [Marinilactibacillus psychrotolerans]
MLIIGHLDKFNQLAATYDTPRNIEMAKRSAEAIRELMDRTQTSKAIDFGCGTGLVGLELIDEFDSLVFMDASAKMIEEVESKLADLNVEKASTLCLNIEEEDILPIKADTIIISLVLHHITDTKNLLSQFYDALNLNGQLLIVEMQKQEINAHHHGHGIDSTDLENELEAIGFQQIQIDRFYDAEKENEGQEASRYALSARKI